MKPIFFIPLLSLSLIAVNSLTISDPCEALLSAYSSVDQAFNALQVSCPTVTVVLNTDAAYSASAAKILNIKSSTASTSSLKLKASQDRATVESKIAFNFNENFASVTLDGLKFTGLTSPISSKSPLVLTGCSFKNGQGVTSSLASDTITGVEVTDSTFTDINPGSARAAILARSSVSISGSSFIRTIGRAVESTQTIRSSLSQYNGNKAISTSNVGGAMLANSIETYKDVFANNQAINGGAIYSLGSVVSESTFDVNKALGGFGGAINGKSVIINGGKFSFNAAKRGGAVYSYGTSQIVGGSYSSNVAEFGGAVFSKTAEVSTQVQFYANAAQFGRSVYVTNGPFRMEMSNQAVPS